MSHHEKLHIHYICVNKLRFLRMALELYRAYSVDIIRQVKARVQEGGNLNALLRVVNEDWASIIIMSLKEWIRWHQPVFWFAGSCRIIWQWTSAFPSMVLSMMWCRQSMKTLAMLINPVARQHMIYSKFRCVSSWSTCIIIYRYINTYMIWYESMFCEKYTYPTKYMKQITACGISGDGALVCGFCGFFLVKVEAIVSLNHEWAEYGHTPTCHLWCDVMCLSYIEFLLCRTRVISRWTSSGLLFSLPEHTWHGILTDKAIVSCEMVKPRSTVITTIIMWFTF